MCTDTDAAVIDKQAILMYHHIFSDLDVISVMAVEGGFHDCTLSNGTRGMRHRNPGGRIGDGTRRRNEDFLEETVLLLRA
jgi:hypothetical protein